MSKAGSLDEQRVERIKLYEKVFKGYTLIVCLLVAGLVFAFSKRVIWVAPDLSTGQEITVNSPYRAYPYSFVYQLLDTMWSWNKSGKSEFPLLTQYAFEMGFLGEELKKELESELETFNNRGVAEGRTRTVKEIIPDDPRRMVMPVPGAAGSKFVVYMDLEVIDRINGNIVSWTYRRYSILVEVNTSNLGSNPYGLKAVRYYRKPVSLNKK
ncbi:TPA: DUF2895 family protein [Vibrio vulnificus]|nr:DUF2895 family protein [Vibrio vulnificus]